MAWTANLYPPRLWTIERRAIRQRLVIVVRVRRVRRKSWAEMLARAA